MKTRKHEVIFCTVILTLLSPATKSGNEDSFIQESTPFELIENINRQGEAWATCAAAFETSSQMKAEASPALSKQLHQLSNGSKIAVMMSSIADKMRPEMTQDEFVTLWDYSKTLMKSLTEVQQTAIMARLEAERASKDKKETGEWFKMLVKTIEVCTSNSAGQQMYVDMWREFAKTMPMSK